MRHGASVGDGAQPVDTTEAAAVLVGGAAVGGWCGLDAGGADAGAVDAGPSAAVVVVDAALALALALTLAADGLAAPVDAGASVAIALVAAAGLALTFTFTFTFTLTLALTLARPAIGWRRGSGGVGEQGASPDQADHDEEEGEARHRGSIAGSAVDPPSW